MLCVGSTALECFDHVNLGREAKDVDLVCTDADFKEYVKWHIRSGYRVIGLENKGSKKVAFLKSNVDGSNRIIEANIWSQQDYCKIGSDSWMLDCLPEKYYITVYGKDHDFSLDMHVVKPEVVLMMKLSHRYKKDSVHFHKTRQDILMLRQQGVELDDYLKEILVEREKLTNPSGYKLNVNKKEFFTDNVPYVVDHDNDLHIPLAHLDQPAYRYYMKDGAEVFCDKEKFFALPEEYRLYGVLEETYVLACERALIPHCTDPKKAFDIALEKVATSVTSGWFREYAWENYDKIQSMYNPKYFKPVVEHITKKYGEDFVREKTKLIQFSML